jgi:glucose dehydrogenase
MLRQALVLTLAAATACPASAQSPANGEWPMAAGDYASWRYSPLTQIDTRNVAQLKPAFTFDTGVLRGHEGAPLVVGDTLYVQAPYPNMLYALDLSKPGAPLKWKYEPKPDAGAQGMACCDVVNRGPA